MSKEVLIKNAVKKYGDFLAINNVSVSIKEGEFFTLLGPSGCGKTTLLRMIAGFNSIEDGDFYFGETRINNIPAHKRDIGMVFQNYAIFPHLSVKDNVAYGLRARGIKGDEMWRRVNKALEMAQIAHLSERKPNELSGGQQQRVALARAIVIEPSLLLMDEPLSNLDAKLRIQMRSIIRNLQRNLKITTIYVTHDQEEALAISDRIAVMRDGVIVQCGTPYEIYTRPSHKFVAGFIGTSNFLHARVEKIEKINDDSCQAEVLLPSAGKSIKVKLDSRASDMSCPCELEVSIRPGQVHIFDEMGKKIYQETENGDKVELEAIMPATVEDGVFLGDYIEYKLRLQNGELIQANAYTHESKGLLNNGTTVYLGFDPSRIRVYDKEDKVLSC